MCDRLFLLTASRNGVSTSDQDLLPCDKLSSPPLSSLFLFSWLSTEVKFCTVKLAILELEGGWELLLETILGLLRLYTSWKMRHWIYFKGYFYSEKALERKDSVFLWRNGKVFILQYNKDSLPLGKVQADLLAAHYKRFGSPKLSFLSCDATHYVSSIFLGDSAMSWGTQGQVTDMTMKRRLFALQWSDASLVSDIRVLHVLPASMTPEEANILACRLGKTPKLSQF